MAEELWVPPFAASGADTLSVCGTPVEGGSTEVLLRAVAESFKQHLLKGEAVNEAFIRLNELNYVPCQACGKAPTPEHCFYEDDLAGIYEKMNVKTEEKI